MSKHRRIPTKSHKLYRHLVRSQFSLPAISFIFFLAVIAGNVVAARHNFVYAASLLPAHVMATTTVSGDIFLTPDGVRPGDNASSSSITSLLGSFFGNSANKTTTSGSGSSKKSSGSGYTNNSSSTKSNDVKTHSNTPSSTTSSTSSPTPQAPAPTPVSVPAPAPAPAPSWTYPLHTNIKTTYFWAGEAASADNDFIQNVSSAWQSNWAAYFGGEDHPTNRCGYNPCAFTPNENPFYFALPFGDFTESGPIANPSVIYWYNAAAQSRLNNGQSILKNRWIQITLGSKTAYAQWEDVGPFNSNDSAYVFGSAAPKSTRAGLDVSPAVRDYLGMGGSAYTSWRFVTDAEVPAGPWKTKVTTSGTDWN